jgi:hypothetical protein
MVVSAQMVTCFRPLLTITASGQFREGQKQFFFEHLRQSVAGTPGPEVADAPAHTGTWQASQARRQTPEDAL